MRQTNVDFITVLPNGSRRRFYVYEHKGAWFVATDGTGWRAISKVWWMPGNLWHYSVDCRPTVGRLTVRAGSRKINGGTRRETEETS